MHLLTVANSSLFIVQAKIDFNSCLSENSQLRETFDHMRLEKKTFDTIRLKLEKELVENKQKIMEGIETSTAAYEARYSIKLYGCYKLKLTMSVNGLNHHKWIQSNVS